MMSLKGKCLCGAVRYEAKHDHAEVGACHCGMCRAWTGGVNLAFEAKPGEIAFAGEDMIETYASSEWAERCFCRRCGSSLFYRLKADGTMYVAAGSLETWDGARMTGEIFVDRKPAAYALAGEHPRMTEAEFFASIGAHG